MGKFRRLNFEATWLFIFLSVGATYMTTGFRWIGVALTTIGVLFLLYQFSDELRGLTKELLVSLAIIPIVIIFVGYVFFFSSPSSQVSPGESPHAQLSLGSGIN